jgi:ribosomal protein S18 acetylase RimI-like enzyme
VLARLYGRDAGHFSFRFSTVALAADRVVGLELGYDREQLGRQAVRGSLLLLRHSPPSRWWHLVARAGRVVDRYVPRPGAGAYYINNLAVAPARRGRGIGERLLTHAVERARRGGYEAVELDVTAVNERAIAFYRRHGFVAVSASGTEALQRAYGLPRLVRMARRPA